MDWQHAVNRFLVRKKLAGQSTISIFKLIVLNVCSMWTGIIIYLKTNFSHSPCIWKNRSGLSLSKNLWVVSETFCMKYSSVRPPAHIITIHSPFLYWRRPFTNRRLFRVSGGRQISTKVFGGRLNLDSSLNKTCLW